MAKQKTTVDFASLRPVKAAKAQKSSASSGLEFKALPKDGSAAKAYQEMRAAEELLKKTKEAYQNAALAKMVADGDLPAINYFPAISFQAWSASYAVPCRGGVPMNPEEYKAHKAAKSGK